MKNNVLVVVGIASLIFLVSCSHSENIETKQEKVGESFTTLLSEACKSSGGTWLEEPKECEYTNAQWCDSQGGEFNECGSACRNNPEAELCTMQCVPVCSFADEEDNDISAEINVLTQEVAQGLVEETLGNCEKNDCDSLEVQVLDHQIEVIYNGLKDDSVRAIKTIYSAEYNGNKWVLGEKVSQEFQCQPGRGQQDFSDTLCN